MRFWQCELRGWSSGCKQGGFEHQCAGVRWLKSPQLQAQQARGINSGLQGVADEVVPVVREAKDDATCACM